MNLRRATLQDLDLMVRVDLDDEGVTPGYREGWQREDFQAHRELIASFIYDADKGSIVADLQNDPSVGVILWRYRNLNEEHLEDSHLFSQIRAVLPPNGIFSEIFQLWVQPTFRRTGIGTQLKLAVEDATRQRDIEMIYTHTEATNAHVIDLNQKLGYREVRRGAIWDDVPRVSLVKELASPADSG